MAYNDLQIIVRGAPASSQAFQLSLGGRRVLETDGQEVGGLRFTIPEFDTTAMVLVTTDFTLADQMKNHLQAIRPRAVDLAIKQARLQLEWVAEINGLLALDEQTVRDADDLLARAGVSLRTAIELQAQGDYEAAWDESRRVGRPLRHLMRLHWEQAAIEMALAARESLKPARAQRLDRMGRPITEGDTNTNEDETPTVIPPIASPPVVAFNTLPQHYVWCDWVRYGAFEKDLLQGAGSFDDATPETLDEGGWTDAGHHPDKVKTTIRLVEAALTGRTAPSPARRPVAASGPGSPRPGRFWNSASPRTLRAGSTAWPRSSTSRPRPSSRRPFRSRPGNWCASASRPGCRAGCRPAPVG